MTEIALVLVIIGLGVLIGWKERENRLLNNKLINALLARNAQDMKDFEMIEKTKEIDVNPSPFPPEFTAVEDMSDDEFDKRVIREEVG